MSLDTPRSSTEPASPAAVGFGLAGLRRRARRPERMDQPGLDPGDHARALRGLSRVNRLSTVRRMLWDRLGALAPAGTPLRVLDVACGGGDNIVALARRAARRGRPWVFDGCDVSPVAVACARTAAARGGATAGYDVVMCSLFLHHLDEADAVRLMQRMAAAARRLVLVDDLVRSRTGYVLAWVGCRVLSRSCVVHHDGPVSVQAAFRPDEAAVLAARAGLRDVSVARHWPQRFLLAGSPS
jgi:2-polyprenyl-3-methyl-5-hydroxy-6-metoxy-1,4-benzoquinol methylase